MLCVCVWPKLHSRNSNSTKKTGISNPIGQDKSVFISHSNIQKPFLSEAKQFWSSRFLDKCRVLFCVCVCVCACMCVCVCVCVYVCVCLWRYHTVATVRCFSLSLIPPDKVILFAKSCCGCYYSIIRRIK